MIYLEDGDLLESIKITSIINEFEADGQTSEPSEDEEFSMDDEGGDATPAAETGEQDNAPTEDEGDEEYSMDDEGEEQQEENNENEPPEEEGEEDEDYEIPDEEEGNQDDAPADDDGGDEEFSMDDEGGESSEGDEEPASDDMGESSDNTNTKLKDLETVVFDELNDKEKELKIKELKELFIQVHTKCGTISGKVADLKTDEETIQIAEYISATLIDLQKYIDDYINNIFDTKTYIENVAHLQKYITIFNAIGKVFNEIRKENAK